KIVKPIEPVVAKKPVKIEVPTTKKVLPQLLTNQLHQQKLTLAAAFTRLFSEFGLKVNDEQIVNPCEMAKQNGYLCLVETGNWRQILQFDRPAILELEDNAGQKYHVVLKKVADDKIYLDLGKEPEFVTTLSQLVPLWNGNYVQLWKPFGPGKYILRQGDQGKNVFKLRELLAAFDDKSLETVTPLIFDEVLTRIVTQFQIKSGLDADGVVGPKTWILLNNSVDTGRPWLIMKGD
ncbi:MAG TPA: hypothetical protein ENJ32_00020, partial [Crenotrichaceae bacterium]|nr:hypothetical protein [Crenotrichaceae bacterium]